MSWKFNPFTGTLDQVGSGGSSLPVDLSPSYAQFPRMISVTADSVFRIKNNGAARIFFSDASEGFDVLGSVTVESGSSLRINTNGRGTVLGV